MNSEMKNNVPKWMADSKTSVTEQNDEVGLIVAGYIGGLRKRGFSEGQLAQILAKAFLLPAEDVFKRIDAVLSCGREGDEENTRNLCVYLANKSKLLSVTEADPCEIIGSLKEKYGNDEAFQMLLDFPDIIR